MCIKKDFEFRQMPNVFLNRVYHLRILKNCPKFSILKESLFSRYTASPPDKGDLGGFFREIFYQTMPSNYL